MAKVTRLPQDPGPAGWARILPDAPPTLPLQDKITADWLVIGAGFAGLAATRRLSQLRPDDRIVVLEATRVGEGPAGRNSGFMIDLPHDLSSKDYGGAVDQDRTQIADNRFAIAFAADMVRALGLPDEAFRQTGKINGAATEKGRKHNESYAAHLNALGEAYEMLDADQMKAMTGTAFYQSGLFTPGTAMIQPAMFVQGVARGLRSNRMEIFEDSPVIALRKATDWVAETPDGQVTAPRVILAVNGHLQSFGHATGRLVHVHTYASMTRPLSKDECARLGGERDWGLTPADPLGTTVRRISGTGGDRIVIRNRFTYDPDLAPAASMESIWRDHDQSYAARFPMLPGVDMAYRWGGRLCLSRNNVQVVSELEPGLFAACCQNGLGTVKGTLAGVLAAELAAGHQSERLDRALAAPAPQKLPPRPLATLGARARLRWGEWRAGQEL